MIPRTGEAILEANRVLGQAYRDAGVPYNHYFSAPACWHYRAFIMITSLPVSRLDPEINRRSRAAFQRLAQVAAEHGWGEYRLPPFGVDFVSNAYSLVNDHALRRFCETLKDAVDPNGIIAAGRGGNLAETFARPARMTTTMAIAAGLALTLCSPSFRCGATAGRRRATLAGKEVYDYWCLPDDGPGLGLPAFSYLPGTQQLRLKYRDTEISPLLTERTDLVPVFVKTIVRQGVFFMPQFRKTEIGDADLDALAAYLARNPQ